MTQSPNDWQREDFIALVLHYAANADLEITPEERTLITKMAGRIHYDKAVTYYDSVSDYEIIEKMIDLKNTFFPGDDGKEELRKILIALFKSDQEFSTMEHVVLNALDRIL